MDKDKTYERHDVKNTPFSLIVETDTGKTKIVIGNQEISDKDYNNELEARKAIKRKDWNILANTIIFFSWNVTKEVNKENNNK